MLATALFAAALAVSSCADNDLDKQNSEGDKGAAVSFDVKDVQEAVLADATPDSRAGDAATFNHQLNELGLTSADLEPQVLEAQTPAGMEACLVETTIPGINPMQPDPQTRATVTKTLTADFSTLGYRGISATNISSTPDWFYNARTKGNGELYDKLLWAWSKRFGRFYAVFPEVKDTYTKIKLSPETHAGNPYVEFEVEPNVVDQKDLMTACSGVVEYQTQFVAPNTSLAFRHALTAIHFSVGQNLWAGQIDKIEISGAINKGTYTLSSDPTQPGTWTLGTTTGTFTLNGININTAASPGSVITDDNGNYTFFMIPQQVTGKNIYVDIHFQDGKTIHVPLKGKWLPGTTKTYTLSNLNSNWQYHLEVLGQNNTAAYNTTDAGTYTVRSYRQSGSVQLPVAWKVVSYQVSNDDGSNWEAETTTKPDWLDNLSLTEGAGGTSALQGSATVKKATMVDKLVARNKTLKSATALGSADSPYDLSTKGESVARSTANCYVISAPGYYKIPLVYGNAITNGSPNTHAYVSQAPTTGTAYDIFVLRTFKDHFNQNITDPWITRTNGGVYAPDAAKLVWTDVHGIVTNLSVTGTGTNAFVKFDVPAYCIKNGNAVIAVTMGGTVVWSWHLWFAPQDVLGTVATINHNNHVYKLPNEPLGLAYTAWSASTYTSPRCVKVKVEQTVGQAAGKQIGYIIIRQSNGNERECSSTLYQFGRKDAFHGTLWGVTPNPRVPKNGGDNMSIKNGIQNPDTFYPWGSTWSNFPPVGYMYSNLWSMDNVAVDFNDNPVVKTIYDPCPAGFKMPPPQAFTGITRKPEGDYFIFPWDHGWVFYNKSVSPDATIYFPALGTRYGTGSSSLSGGSLIDVGYIGHYWFATPLNYQSGCQIGFSGNPNLSNLTPTSAGRSEGFAVYPIKDE